MVLCFAALAKRANALLAAANASKKQNLSKEKTMEIEKLGSQPSGKSPADWFTERFVSTRCSPLTTSRWFRARALRASRVREQPGHTHPLG